IERARSDESRDPRALHERLHALRDATREALEPNARRLVASLTPEQRAKLEAAAERHGRKFDAERLTERFTRLLAHPRFAQRMQERAQHRGEGGDARAPRTR